MVNNSYNIIKNIQIPLCLGNIPATVRLSVRVRLQVSVRVRVRVRERPFSDILYYPLRGLI